jgi:hypothetical protein
MSSSQSPETDETLKHLPVLGGVSQRHSASPKACSGKLSFCHEVVSVAGTLAEPTLVPERYSVILSLMVAPTVSPRAGTLPEPPRRSGYC